MPLELKPLVVDERGRGLYTDTLERVYVGLRGRRRVNAKTVADHLYFLGMQTLSTIDHDYVISEPENPEPEPKQEATAQQMCPVCGTPLTAKQVKRGGKFCSPTCRGKSMKKDD